MDFFKEERQLTEVVVIGTEQLDTGKIKESLLRSGFPDASQIHIWGCEDQRHAEHTINKPEYLEADLLQIDPRSSVVLTDSPQAARRCSDQGFLCAGISDTGDFFSGAVVVYQNAEDLDTEELEHLLLRFTDRPVIVARTERLVMREIAEEDCGPLWNLSCEEGMELAMPSFARESFLPERLLEYRKYVYRFYGYGLWSVFTKDGTLIGCCGLSDFEPAGVKSEDNKAMADKMVNEMTGEMADVSDTILLHMELSHFAHHRCHLELQYMLTKNARGKGYAEEMCRQAIRFALFQTEATDLWVRIRKENLASLQLAKKLGFVLTSS